MAFISSNTLVINHNENESSSSLSRCPPVPAPALVPAVSASTAAPAFLHHPLPTHPSQVFNHSDVNIRGNSGTDEVGLKAQESFESVHSYRSTNADGETCFPPISQASSIRWSDATPFIDGNDLYRDYEEEMTRGDEEEFIDAFTSIVDSTCKVNNALFEIGQQANEFGYRETESTDGESGHFYSFVPVNLFSIRDYIARLVRGMAQSRSVFIVALIYLDRVQRVDSSLSLNYLNVHRLLSTAVILACKFMEDIVRHDRDSAYVAGFTLGSTEYKKLEWEFLKRLNWDTRVDAESFCVFENIIVGHKVVARNVNNVNLGAGVYEVDVVIEVEEEVKDKDDEVFEKEEVKVGNNDVVKKEEVKDGEDDVVDKDVVEENLRLFFQGSHQVAVGASSRREVEEMSSFENSVPNELPMATDSELRRETTQNEHQLAVRDFNGPEQRAIREQERRVADDNLFRAFGCEFGVGSGGLGWSTEGGSSMGLGDIEEGRSMERGGTAVGVEIHEVGDTEFSGGLGIGGLSPGAVYRAPPVQRRRSRW